MLYNITVNYHRRKNMAIDKKVLDFKERLEEVFKDDIEPIGWRIDLADKFTDKSGELKQTYFLFKEAKNELMITYDHQLKMTIIKLTLNENDKKQVFGIDNEFTIVSKDKSKLEEANDTALDKLSNREKPVFKRISRYIDLKISEFIY